MKLNLQFDCDTPRKELIKDLTVSFVSYDLDSVRNLLSENVVWNLVGDKPIEGRANFIGELQKMSGNKAQELTIFSIISEAEESAIHGEILMEDGNRFGFSDFYVFAPGKDDEILSITSYVIQKGG